MILTVSVINEEAEGDETPTGWARSQASCMGSLMESLSLPCEVDASTQGTGEQAEAWRWR